MTLEQLCDAVSGYCLCDYSSTHGFVDVVTDSRSVKPSYLFVPLMGTSQDGHSYIPKALEAGASVVFVDTAHGDGNGKLLCELAKKHNAAIVVVDNTLRALQDAARRYLTYFPQLLRIGITGSSGKSTTKEIAASVFSQGFKVIVNEGNLNSETGLPLSVFRVDSSHEVGIFEMGMNRRGEIAELARVLNPQLAVITNIGTAHIGILGSKQAIAEEKKSIFSQFTSACTGFIPEDPDWNCFLATGLNGRIITYGEQSTGGCEYLEDLGIRGSVMRIDDQTVRFPLPGKHNYSNVLAVTVLARAAGITSCQLRNGLESVKPLTGRVQVFEGNVTVLADCYNANPESMSKALDLCINLVWTGHKFFVLGSMLELGDSSESAHYKIIKKIAGLESVSVFLFGKEMVEAYRTSGLKNSQIRSFYDFDMLKMAIFEAVGHGDFVLLKGSRAMALERLLPVLLPGSEGAEHD